MGGSEAAAPVGSDGLGQPVGEQRAASLRSLSLLVLTMGSGATDALAFLGLGGVFTANMTGNLVLVGLVGRTDYPGAAFRAVVACIGFGAAVRVSVMITRRFPDRPTHAGDCLAGDVTGAPGAVPRVLVAGGRGTVVQSDDQSGRAQFSRHGSPDGGGEVNDRNVRHHHDVRHRYHDFAHGRRLPVEGAGFGTSRRGRPAGNGPRAPLG